MSCDFQTRSSRDDSPALASNGGPSTVGSEGSEMSTTSTPPWGMPSWPPSVRLPMYGWPRWIAMAAFMPRANSGSWQPGANEPVLLGGSAAAVRGRATITAAIARTALNQADLHIWASVPRVRLG